MNRPEFNSPVPNEEQARREINAVVTNYDRVTSAKGQLEGWQRATAEYEKRGLAGVVQKVKYNFLRQTKIRGHIREAQREVKKNSESLLLDSRAADEAVKGLNLTDKPFISREELHAYRETIAVDEKHEDRLDEAKYSAQQQLLEAKLQNMVVGLAKYSKRTDVSHRESKINSWVTDAINQLPDYYREEDRAVITQQIAEIVDEAIKDYDDESAKHQNPQEVAKINLMLAGMHQYGGKSKAKYLLKEGLTHPTLWAGAMIAVRAAHLVPGIGGLLAAGRKRARVSGDLERMNMEQVHGIFGKQDKYRQELSETFTQKALASEIIARMESALQDTDVEKVNDADPVRLTELVYSLGVLRAVNESGFQAIAYDEDNMQRQKLQLLRLQSKAQIRIRKFKLESRVVAARNDAASQLTKRFEQQEKNQRKLKNKKAVQAGVVVGGISLATLGLAQLIPDEVVESASYAIDNAAGKVSEAAKTAYSQFYEAASAAEQAAEPVTEQVQIQHVGDGQPPIEYEADPSIGDGTGGTSNYAPELFENAPEVDTESHSLWQELVEQQEQRDTSNDQFITYGTPLEGEHNELELKYESGGDSEFIVNVSGMEGNADGVDGDEFPEDEQLYAVFYLTEQDHAVGNEIRVPIPADGHLVINEENHPELIPLFENRDGEVCQQFAVLGIASENTDGSMTFYASNWDSDIPASVIEEMKDTEIATETSVETTTTTTTTTETVTDENTDPNGNPIVEIGEAEEVVPEDEDEDVDPNGNPIQDVNEPPVVTTPPPATTPVTPTTSGGHNFVPFALAVDNPGMMSNLKKEQQAQQSGEIIDPLQPPKNGLGGGQGPVLGPKLDELLQGPLQRELIHGPLKNEIIQGPLQHELKKQGEEVDGEISESEISADQKAELEKKRAEEAAAQAAATDTKAAESAPKGDSAASVPEAAKPDATSATTNGEVLGRPSGSINSENNTNNSGNVIQNNSGAIEFNNTIGMTGAEQIKMRELENERAKEDLADRRHERESRDKSEARFAATVSEAFGGVRELALKVASNSETSNPELQHYLEQNMAVMTSLVDGITTASQANERLVSMLEDQAEENRLTSNELVGWQALHSDLVRLMESNNRVLELMVIQARAQVTPATANSDLVAALDALRRDVYADRESIRNEQSAQVSDRIRRLRNRRELPRATRSRGRTKKDLFGQEAQPNRSSNTRNRSETRSEQRPAPENWNKEFAKQVSNARNTARKRLKALYPDRYEELKEPLRNKITEEFRLPWESNDGGEEGERQREQWLAQLENDAFYAELAGESIASQEEVSSSAESDDSQPNKQPTGEDENSATSQTAANEQPGFRIKDEDREDYENGRRAQQRAINEEFDESKAGMRAEAKRIERKEAKTARQMAAQVNATNRQADQSQNAPESARAEARASVEVRPITLREPSQNQIARRDQFNQNDVIPDAEVAGVAKYLKGSLNFMPIPNAAKNSLRAEYDKNIDDLMNQWQAGNLTVQEREARMNEVFSGALLNRLISEARGAISYATEPATPESVGPIDGSPQTLERLVKRFGNDQRLSFNARSLNELNNEQFGQQYGALYSQIDSLLANNELSEEQRSALEFLRKSYNLMGENLGARTAGIEGPDFGSLQSELAQLQDQVKARIESWEVGAKPENVNESEYKAEQVQEIKTELLQPLAEQRTKVHALLGELYSDIEGVREQSSQVKPYIQTLPGSEDIFALSDEVLERIERAASRLSEQLRGINTAIQTFEEVLEAWQKTN